MLSKRQSLSPTTVIFRTTLTRTITLHDRILRSVFKTCHVTLEYFRPKLSARQHQIDCLSVRNHFLWIRVLRRYDDYWSVCNYKLWLHEAVKWWMDAPTLLDEGDIGFSVFRFWSFLTSFFRFSYPLWFSVFPFFDIRFSVFPNKKAHLFLFVGILDILPSNLDPR